jgi:radical SAM protein (TIGR01212 family)
MADKQGLNVCAHIILGLPGENRDMMLETAHFLSVLPIKGVKIHLLYVVKGTQLASLYQKKKPFSSEEKNFQCLERDVYIERVVDVLERLRPDIIIHRLTGDPVGEELVAPLWAKQKTENLNLIRKRLTERDTWQGKKYQTSTAGK